MGEYFRSEASVLDWSSKTWTKSSNLRDGRHGHGCAMLEGQGVLVVGGMNENLQYVFLLLLLVSTM